MKKITKVWDKFDYKIYKDEDNEFYVFVYDEKIIKEPKADLNNYWNDEIINFVLAKYTTEEVIDLIDKIYEQEIKSKDKEIKDLSENFNKYKKNIEVDTEIDKALKILKKGSSDE